jgi:hypothetical protein
MTPDRVEWVSVLVRPPQNSWRMFEEVPSRALFPRAGVAGPTRRGPHAGLRRPLSSASAASQPQRILPTAGQAGDGKAGRSDRAHARGTSESEPHGGTEGQRSKLLTCLGRNGLLANTGGYPASGNAWLLTANCEAVIDAHRPLKQAQRGLGPGTGAPNAWTLTGSGREIAQSISAHTTGLQGE